MRKRRLSEDGEDLLGAVARKGGREVEMVRIAGVPEHFNYPFKIAEDK